MNKPLFNTSKREKPIEPSSGNQGGSDLKKPPTPLSTSTMSDAAIIRPPTNNLPADTGNRKHKTIDPTAVPDHAKRKEEKAGSIVLEPRDKSKHILDSVSPSAKQNALDSNIKVPPNKSLHDPNDPKKYHPSNHPDKGPIPPSKSTKPIMVSRRASFPASLTTEHEDSYQALKQNNTHPTLDTPHQEDKVSELPPNLARIMTPSKNDNPDSMDENPPQSTARMSLDPSPTGMPESQKIKYRQDNQTQPWVRQYRHGRPQHAIRYGKDWIE